MPLGVGTPPIMGYFMAGNTQDATILDHRFSSSTLKYDMVERKPLTSRPFSAILTQTTMLFKQFLPDFLFYTLFGGLFLGDFVDGCALHSPSLIFL
jgi:hypothetical protein